MRMIPPDVQRALKFFQKPEEEGDDDAIPSTGDAKIDAIIGMQFDTVKEFVNNNHEVARGEVSNVMTAVLGVQRESSISSGKVEDLARRHEALRSHVERALPQIISILKKLHIPGDADEAQKTFFGKLE